MDKFLLSSNKQYLENILLKMFKDKPLETKYVNDFYEDAFYRFASKRACALTNDNFMREFLASVPVVSSFTQQTTYEMGKFAHNDNYAQSTTQLLENWKTAPRSLAKANYGYVEPWADTESIVDQSSLFLNNNYKMMNKNIKKEKETGPNVDRRMLSRAPLHHPKRINMGHEMTTDSFTSEY